MTLPFIIEATTSLPDVNRDPSLILYPSDNLNESVDALVDLVYTVDDPGPIMGSLPDWQYHLYELPTGNVMLAEPIDTPPQDPIDTK